MASNILYVANENGDWWTMNPDSKLYVLRPSDIPEELSPDDDKFEQTIMEHGVEVVEVYNDLASVLSS